jgi:hypothetical protein
MITPDLPAKKHVGTARLLPGSPWPSNPVQTIAQPCASERERDDPPNANQKLARSAPRNNANPRPLPSDPLVVRLSTLCTHWYTLVDNKKNFPGNPPPATHAPFQKLCALCVTSSCLPQTPRLAACGSHLSSPDPKPPKPSAISTISKRTLKTFGHFNCSAKNFSFVQSVSPTDPRLKDRRRSPAQPLSQTFSIDATHAFR